MRFMTLSTALLSGVIATSTNAQNNDSLVEYHSVFSHYQPFLDAPLANWYQANQTVQQIGGWRVYMQEAMNHNDQSSHSTHSSSASTESQSNQPHSHSHHGHSMMPGGEK